MGLELKSDISLNGSVWSNVIDKYVKTFFGTQWGVFKLSLAIGILYDKQMDDSTIAKGSEDKGHSIPRNMFIRNAKEMEFFFETAILTSSCIELDEKDRLYLAFSDDITAEEMDDEDIDEIYNGVSKEAITFDRFKFLKQFANYGATKLEECISKNLDETMENLMNFLNSSYLGETPELIELQKVDDIIEDDELE